MTKPTIRELLDDVRSDVDSTHEMAASELAERAEAVLKLVEPLVADQSDSRHGLAREVLRALDGE